MPPSHSDGRASDASDVRSDVVVLGGGLAGCLAALAIHRRRPSARVVLVERAERLAGNHTWSCFANDVNVWAADCGTTGEAWTLLEPLIEKRWPSYLVKFPGSASGRDFERRIDSEYLTVTSDRLRDVTGRAFATSPTMELRLNAEVASVRGDSGGTSVVLETGERLRADQVIDARGLPTTADAGRCGFQKFLGQEVMVSGMASDAGEPAPLLMDACVPQDDGFRFMYALPLNGDRWLLEDTSFSDGPALDTDDRRARIAAYASTLGLRIERVIREEHGVLPMPWGLDPLGSDARSTDSKPTVIGYRASLFHAGTGYSLPFALATATVVARADGAAFDNLRQSLSEQNRFFGVLNRLLFRGVRPERRHETFRRFYGLPDDTIGRFYAARCTRLDRARILLGKPPRQFRWKALANSWRQSSRGSGVLSTTPETREEAL